MHFLNIIQYQVALKEGNVFEIFEKRQSTNDPPPITEQLKFEAF